jgi:hypothetical protein
MVEEVMQLLSGRLTLQDRVQLSDTHPGEGGEVVHTFHDASEVADRHTGKLQKQVLGGQVPSRLAIFLSRAAASSLRRKRRSVSGMVVARQR